MSYAVANAKTPVKRKKKCHSIVAQAQRGPGLPSNTECWKYAPRHGMATAVAGDSRESLRGGSHALKLPRSDVGQLVAQPLDLRF